MTDPAMPAIFEGAVVHLLPGYACWRALSQGRRTGAPFGVDQMLFEAGRSLVSGDLFAGFWRDEAADMDWLEDFLCDPATEKMVLDLLAPPEEEEVVESLYTKTYLVTLGSDVMDR